MKISRSDQIYKIWNTCYISKKIHLIWCKQLYKYHMYIYINIYIRLSVDSDVHRANMYIHTKYHILYLYNAFWILQLFHPKDTSSYIHHVSAAQHVYVKIQLWWKSYRNIANVREHLGTFRLMMYLSKYGVSCINSISYLLLVASCYIYKSRVHLGQKELPNCSDPHWNSGSSKQEISWAVKPDLIDDDRCHRFANEHDTP